jgi:hypothetical protein
VKNEKRFIQISFFTRPRARSLFFFLIFPLADFFVLSFNTKILADATPEGRREYIKTLKKKKKLATKTHFFIFIF